MENLVLQEMALQAAMDYDALRLNKPIKNDNVKRIITALRSMFPIGVTTLADSSIQPSNLVVISRILEGIIPMSRIHVAEVITDVNKLVDDMEASWADRRYNKMHFDFVMAISKATAPRFMIY